MVRETTERMLHYPLAEAGWGMIVVKSSAIAIAWNALLLRNPMVGV